MYLWLKSCTVGSKVHVLSVEINMKLINRSVITFSVSVDTDGFPVSYKMSLWSSLDEESITPESSGGADKSDSFKTIQAKLYTSTW